MPNEGDCRDNAAIRIYRELRAGILAGSLAPGQKLAERKVMERFSVSRTPVREALKALEREGLVRSHSKSGTIITSLTPHDVAEVYRVRLVLEPLAVSLAVTQLSEEDRAEMLNMERAMSAAVAGGNYLEYLYCDADIHFWIAQKSGNSLLARMIGDLTGQILRLGVASIAQTGRPERSLAEHKSLLRALMEGRGVDASNAMVVHLSNSERDALRTMLSRAEELPADMTPAAGQGGG
jgi:DNA-binding GntR family transcriptional regulator